MLENPLTWERKMYNCNPLKKSIVQIFNNLAVKWLGKIMKKKVNVPPKEPQSTNYKKGVVQNKNIPTLAERNGSCGYGEHMAEIYI